MKGPLRLEHVAAEAVQFCQELVRINTTNPYSGDARPGSEAAGQAYIESVLKETGARITRFEPPEDIYERMGMIGPRGRSFDGRPNLVAEWTFGLGSGPRIVLQGHIDTVGADGMELEDPFSGHLADGRVWGRGASDMKGGMGAMLAAVREVARLADRLNGSLLLLSVVDEECDGSGAGSLACMERGYRGDVAISVDGSGPAIVRGYGGVVTGRIIVQGKGGHAAAPIDLSEPTVMERAVALAQGVFAFRKHRWQERQSPSNLGTFHSGDHPATVAHRAELGVNLSYTFDEALAAEAAGKGYGAGPLRQAFEAHLRAIDSHAAIEWVKDAIPFETAASQGLVGELAEAHRLVLGIEPEVTTAVAWTDACHLWYHGKMPTVVYGAGSPDQAHTPTESVEVWRVEACAQVLATYLYTALTA